MSFRTQSTLWIAVAASIGVHAALALMLGREEAPPDREDEGLLVDVEVEPPAPPAPFMPEDLEVPQVEHAEPEPEPEPEKPIEVAKPAPEPEPEPEPVKEPVKEKETEVAVADAGPVDAATDAATAVALADAGAPSDGGADGGQAVAAAAVDAGPPPNIGSSLATPTATTDRPPPGATADLRPYVPKGELMAATLRFDRMRGTKWAKRVDAILAPMPDYRMIVGARDVLLADLFDVLVMASNNPRDVTRTHLAAYTEKMTPKELRAFLDHADAPVTWQASRGGALGTRGPTKLAQPNDPRVYLMPFPGWTLLTRPKFLGELGKPTDGDVDTAAADAAALPQWLTKAASVREQSGGKRKKGPIVVASFHAKRARLDIPMLGEIPGPDRLSVALEIASTGFLATGTLAFGSEADAAEFERVVNDGKARMVETRVGRSLLQQFHALNAAKGLTLTRRGSLIGFVTSFSEADGVAMCETAAELSRRYFADGAAGE